jgi:hypothetical protein
MLKLGFAVVFYRPDERFEDYTDANVGVSVGVKRDSSENTKGSAFTGTLLRTHEKMRLQPFLCNTGLVKHILKYLAENPYLTAEQLGE